MQFYSDNTAAAAPEVRSAPPDPDAVDRLVEALQQAILEQIRPEIERLVAGRIGEIVEQALQRSLTEAGAGIDEALMPILRRAVHSAVTESLVHSGPWGAG